MKIDWFRAAAGVAIGTAIAPLSIKGAELLGSQKGFPARTAAETPDDDALADIVVTARRRAEALQYTPVAVTALGSADLEARSVTRAVAPLVAAYPDRVLWGAIGRIPICSTRSRTMGRWST